MTTRRNHRNRASSSLLPSPTFEVTQSSPPSLLGGTTILHYVENPWKNRPRGACSVERMVRSPCARRSNHGFHRASSPGTSISLPLRWYAIKRGIAACGRSRSAITAEFGLWQALGLAVSAHPPRSRLGRLPRRNRAGHPRRITQRARQARGRAPTPSPGDEDSPPRAGDTFLRSRPHPGPCTGGAL